MKYKITNGSVTLDGNTILEEINFEINSTDKIGIVGRNGAGKTTLLNSLIDNNLLEEGIGEDKFNITKIGKFIVKDETPPTFEVKNVTVVEGGTINPSDFSANCFDFSGCNYSFQDSDTESKTKTAGSYVIYVTATDAYKNTTTKKASLTVEAPGATRKYRKTTPFDFNTGYEVEETYELHFAAYEW